MCRTYNIATNGFSDTITFTIDYNRKYELSEGDTFEQRIRKLRKQKNLTTEELSEIIDQEGTTIRA